MGQRLHRHRSGLSGTGGVGLGRGHRAFPAGHRSHRGGAGAHMLLEGKLRTQRFGDHREGHHCGGNRIQSRIQKGVQKRIQKRNIRDGNRHHHHRHGRCAQGLHLYAGLSARQLRYHPAAAGGAVLGLEPGVLRGSCVHIRVHVGPLHARSHQGRPPHWTCVLRLYALYDPRGHALCPPTAHIPLRRGALRADIRRRRVSYARAGLQIRVYVRTLRLLGAGGNGRHVQQLRCHAALALLPRGSAQLDNVCLPPASESAGGGGYTHDRLCERGASAAVRVRGSGGHALCGDAAAIGADTDRGEEEDCIGG
mmetsp:Transcript_3883/g.8758  ORF Transcript_3883/g.8758 Transcript_3883/m.8758 type:complete len:309 (+) Transcript_3883:748-1674(+)